MTTTTTTSQQKDARIAAKETCPNCGERGRKVQRVTLESLLRPERSADIGDQPYHVCLTQDCETVYFAAGAAATFVKSDLAVRFGLKEAEQPRPVCYCFNHSIEGIHDEIRRTGRSTVLAGIKAAMKGSGCRCEYTNPLGACCLNTVNEVVQEGLRQFGTGDATVAVRPEADCCSTDPTQPLATERAGLWAASGSVFSAALASACCWLPLLLIAFGVSAAGVAGFFEAYRSYFIAGAVGLLGFGFYTVYFRRPACAPGSACCVPSSKLRTFNQIMLWTATTLVCAFIFFPNYVGRLLASQTAGQSPALGVELVADTFHVEGMTCEGCAAGLRSTLAKLPNVASVEVDYATKTAVVRYATGDVAGHAEVGSTAGTASNVIEAINAAGFTATLADAP